MNMVADMWRFAEAASHGMSKPTDEFPEFNDCIIYTSLVNDEDFAYIAEFSNRLIFAFQGTKNLKAWIGDVDAFPLKDPNPESYLNYHNDPLKKGTIHCNFYKSWLYFKPIFQDYLIKYASNKTDNEVTKDTISIVWKQYNLPPIYHVGHSRGGALSPLAARDTAKNLGIPCSCFAFGAPRIGTKEFRDEIDILPINYLNTHHGAEFTQFLPPELAGFRHAGRPLQLNEPKWHMLFNKIKDHFYSTTTDAMIKYCKIKKDDDGLQWMKIVRKRVNI